VNRDGDSSGDCNAQRITDASHSHIELTINTAFSLRINVYKQTYKAIVMFSNSHNDVYGAVITALPLWFIS